jgi:hypothetical protein
MDGEDYKAAYTEWKETLVQLAADDPGRLIFPRAAKNSQVYIALTPSILSLCSESTVFSKS